MDKLKIADALCIIYKEWIIGTLEALGLEYDEGIDTKNLKDMNLKKFLAWKYEINKLSERNLLEFSYAIGCLAEHIDYLKSVGYKDLKFNLRDVEALIDKDSFATFFRTCIVFEEVRKE